MLADGTAGTAGAPLLDSVKLTRVINYEPEHLSKLANYISILIPIGCCSLFINYWTGHIARVSARMQAFQIDQ